MHVGTLTEADGLQAVGGLADLVELMAQQTGDGGCLLVADGVEF